MKSLKQLAELSRHPLVITIVGFMLTGVVGAGFTWWLNSLSATREAEHAERARRGELEAAERARAVEAVREVTDLINERRTRAVLVAYAIHRHSPEAEVEARKSAYDDVYVRWNTKSQSISLRIREIFKQLAPSGYEGYISALTHEVALGHQTGVNLSSKPTRQGLLTQMDTCVTGAFDAYRLDKFENTTTAEQILTDCDFDGIDLQLIECSTILADSLYVIVNTMDNPKYVEEKIRTDAKEINLACNPRSPGL
jgi:hypothetical protein